MKEIEILYKLEEDLLLAENKVKNFIFEDSSKLEYKGKKKVIDTYYKSKTFKDLNPNENNKLFSSLRTRESGGSVFVTHKRDNFDSCGVWVYSNELEAEVKDIDIFKKILKETYFEELVKIDNTKKIYESKNYELVLEKVADLGNFIEIEYKSKTKIKDEDVEGIKKEIRFFLSKLGIKAGEELNAGKPELMLKSKQNKLKK